MSDQSSGFSRIADALGRRPAIALLIFLAGGICCRDYFPVHPWYWIILTAGLLIAGILHIHRSILSTILLAICVFLLGLSASQIERFSYPARQIWTYTRDTERLAQIELKLNESPRLLGQPQGKCTDAGE